MTGRHVVITGLGAITPSGNGAEATWASVRDGRSAITTIDESWAEALPVRIGGRVRFDASDVLERSLARRLSPVQHWAIAAADEAMTHAGIAQGARLPWDHDRVHVLAATGSGPVDAMQQATRALDAKGPRGVPLTLAVYGAADAAAALLSQRYDIRGTAHAISATCASGTIALGDGLRSIRHGYADAVLVVGMEDCLTPVNLASNANLRSLAAGFEHEPTRASRPFDRSRSGFVMAQGAAAILLEAEEVARARGVEPLARLAGFGAASDAHHATAPHPAGRGAARAIVACLADAGVDASDVDHVNAHGTGTPAGDAAELVALEAALGPAARSIPITATKSSTGHLLGAAGVLEAMLSVQTILHETVPPTINLDDPEGEGWDFVTKPRAARLRTALSTSFGFGGHDAAVLIARVDGRDA